MSTIPGGCFVAPDSLRRLNQLQKQHAREAKLQATKSSTGPDAAHIQTSSVPPPTLTDQNKSTLTNMLTTVPQRVGEFWGRSRSQSNPDWENNQSDSGRTRSVSNPWPSPYSPVAPMRLSELWGRSRSPQSSPPDTPPASPKVLHSPLAETAPELITKSKLAENNNNKEIPNSPHF